MKREERIGAAVIGCGIYGEVHVRTYRKDPRTELVKIWSRSRERAKKIGEKYHCAYTTDLNELAEDKNIKIVSIATPDFAHTEPALMMLKAGKDILIEKPMATSVKECEKILETQKRSGGKIMVNFHNRWYPPVVKAKEVIQHGEIGKPVSAFARLSDLITVPTQMLSWAGRSGPQWFLFPHTIDLIRWFFNNQEAKKVFALGKKEVLRKRGIETYDVVHAQVEFSQAIAIFESSWILPDSWRNNLIEFKIDIYGEKGRIGITGDSEGIEISTDRYKTPLLYDFVTEEEPIKYFIDCVINDKNPSPDGRDGLEVTRIIEAIDKSLEEKEAIEL